MYGYGYIGEDYIGCPGHENVIECYARLRFIDNSSKYSCSDITVHRVLHNVCSCREKLIIDML